MSTRKLLVLVVILLGLVLYIYKVELPQDEAKKEEGRVVKNLKAGELQSIEVKKAGTDLILVNTKPEADKELKAAEWQIKELPNAPLDESSLRSLVMSAI